MLESADVMWYLVRLDLGNDMILPCTQSLVKVFARNSSGFCAVPMLRLH